MKGKRILASMLTATMALGCLTGCSQTEETAAPKETQSTQAPTTAAAVKPLRQQQKVLQQKPVEHMFRLQQNRLPSVFYWISRMLRITQFREMKCGSLSISSGG